MYTYLQTVKTHAQKAIRCVILERSETGHPVLAAPGGGAMTSLCAPILLALLVLMLTLPLCQQAAPGWRSMEVLDPGSSMLTGHALGAEFTSEPRGGRFPQTAALEVHPRDVRHKEKFIRHLTGPLYFNPKCRKHFYRLYHNTRDCNVPAYYKRCARLLIRLAGSPRCMER